jgi:hypothetical protein
MSAPRMLACNCPAIACCSESELCCSTDCCPASNAAACLHALLLFAYSNCLSVVLNTASSCQIMLQHLLLSCTHSSCMPACPVLLIPAGFLSIHGCQQQLS